MDINKIFLRPRFSFQVAISADEILSIFKKEKESSSKKFLIKIVGEHIFIDVLSKDSHFWSPHLHLELESEGDSTKVKGLFGPKPQVWTLFMFLHFVVATFFIGCGVWVYVNSSLDKTNTFPIVMLVVLPIVWVTFYLFGRLGRDFGNKQMKQMQRFLVEKFELKN